MICMIVSKHKSDLPKKKGKTLDSARFGLAKGTSNKSQASYLCRQTLKVAPAKGPTRLIVIVYQRKDVSIGLRAQLYLAKTTHFTFDKRLEH